MPKIIETIRGAKTVWAGDEPFTVPGSKPVIRIWKIKLENSKGERELFSTMSEHLATQGFEGDVEVYENDNGKIYARKAPQEDHHANKSNSSGNKNNYSPDGQRQGMCFNNATRYVTATAEKPLSPREFADAVFAYAEALYLKGDLGSVEVQTKLPIEVSDEETEEEKQEDIALAVSRHIDDGEPINLDDIPF